VKGFWGVAAGVSTVLGLLGLYAFIPKLSLEPSQNQANTNFLALNSYWKTKVFFAINSISYALKVRDLKFPEGVAFRNGDISYPARSIPQLLIATRKATITVGDFVNLASPTYGNMEISVSYTAKFFPKTLHNAFRFTCVRRGDNLAWFPRAQSEKW